MRIVEGPDMIVGLDLGGSKIAASYFYVEHGDARCIAVTEYRSKERSRPNQIFEAVEQLQCDHLWKQATYVFMEEPLVGRGVRASLQLSQMAGAIMYDIGFAGKSESFMLVPVTRWKQATVGKGNASKEQVKEWLIRQYPVYAAACGDSQDLIDATCIALYGAAVVAQSRSLALTGTDAEPDERAARSDPA